MTGVARARPVDAMSAPWLHIVGIGEEGLMA